MRISENRDIGLIAPYIWHVKQLSSSDSVRFDHSGVGWCHYSYQIDGILILAPIIIASCCQDQTRLSSLLLSLLLLLLFRLIRGNDMGSCRRNMGQHLPNEVRPRPHLSCNIQPSLHIWVPMCLAMDFDMYCRCNSFDSFIEFAVYSTSCL